MAVKDQKFKITFYGLYKVHWKAVFPVSTGMKHFWTKDAILKPDSTVYDNKSMCGFSNLSQVMVFYAITHKRLKWYCKTVEVFWKLTLYNYYIIWKKLKHSNQDQLIYCITLVKEIFTLNSFSPQAYNPGPSRPLKVAVSSNLPVARGKLLPQD